ncbi:MAG TPA: hypothetical protein VGD77_10930 [Gemmatimonadaceae bacterium]
MARYHPLTRIAPGERLPRAAEVERETLALARRALTLAYDCGRLPRGDPEFTRVRREVTAARRQLATRLRELQALAAGEARLDLHEQLNARLWSIYNAVPGELAAASDAELRRVRQLVMKTIEWFGQRTAG